MLVLMTELCLKSRARSHGLALAVVAAGLAAGVLLAPSRALAIGESITDVRVLDNARTEESTVRSIAGLSQGDVMEADTLDRVRERLNTTGLFADVNVWWEPHGEGVRVNISVKDKFPWAPVPTASWSANNKSFGLIFVHGNLFGRGKQLAVGGRIATIDSGALIAYRDPALFGSWIYWQMQGSIQRQIIPQYQNYGFDMAGNPISLANPLEIDETHLLAYGFEGGFGVAWLRRVKTQVLWNLSQWNYNGTFDPTTGTQVPPGMATTTGGLVGTLKASLTFDFRAREFAIMHGTALSAGLEYASPDFKSDFTYWRVGASWEHGIKILRSCNFVYVLGANAGHNMPYWVENTAGGPNLRGYLNQQFRGDTQAGAKVEFHFPLFSIGSLDFRALGFYDMQAIWFREVPTDLMGMNYVRPTPDMRNFPPDNTYGFSWNQSVHNDVGAGLRFFLRSVAVPLVGFDAGYGIEANNWRFILIIGA
jgi:outer membrane protein assembly factor BamA